MRIFFAGLLAGTPNMVYSLRLTKPPLDIDSLYTMERKQVDEDHPVSFLEKSKTHHPKNPIEYPRIDKIFDATRKEIARFDEKTDEISHRHHKEIDAMKMLRGATSRPDIRPSNDVEGLDDIDI